MHVPKVLVATPVHSKTKPYFVERSFELYNALTYANLDVARQLNHYHRCPELPGSYHPHAAARNLLINNHLRADHDYVLWVDVDIVWYPENLVESLLGIVDRYSRPIIVAPMVMVEKLDPALPPSEENGGWFYDVGGFIFRGEQTNRWYPHWPSTDAFLSMDSVGACYLVPAFLYRQGVRYCPEGDSVEHNSFMKLARQHGVQPIAHTKLEVHHAYLPKYGQWWNG